VGVYSLHLLDIKDGQVRSSQFMGASVNYSPEFLASEPNANLLRRIAESGGGKVLDPTEPSLNPFLHDRQKTFQPRDLWQTLLKWAIVLFTLDVAVRRIQIDREEMARAWRWIRQRVFFWDTVPRTPEAEEGLAALLARRDQVRSKTTVAPAEARPELFQPVNAPADSWTGTTEAAKPASSPAAAVAEPAESAEEASSTTTSRLLEAKRRAQHRRKP
jgi:hypothetical protein